MLDRQILDDLIDIMGDEYVDLISVYLEDAPKSLHQLSRAVQASSGFASSRESFSSSACARTSMRVSFSICGGVSSVVTLGGGCGGDWSR